jgi:hypothetical protein
MPMILKALLCLIYYYDRNDEYVDNHEEDVSIQNNYGPRVFGSLLTERRNRTSNNFVDLYKGQKRIATICFDYIHMPGDYFMKVLSSNLSSTLHQLFDDGYLADGIQIL